MSTTTDTHRRTRRVTIAALSGTTALAVLGGSMLTATAANAADPIYTCTTTTGTQLVSFGAAGGGLINLGSSGGLLGVATGSNGAQINLLNCVVAVNLGSTTSVVLNGTPVVTLPTTPVTIPTTPVTVPTTPTDTPTTPTTPVLTPTPGASTGSTDSTGTSSTSTSSTGTSSTGTSSTSTTSTSTTTPAGTTTPTTTTTPASTALADLTVASSSTTVYPAKDGYKDGVTFSVKGLTSAAKGVKVTGTAVLKKGTKVVKTWTISSATSKLTWNGRIGKKVMAGVYTLTVTAKSADGVKRVSSMTVRVSAKHLVTRTVQVKSKDIANRSTAVTPKKVIAALKLGKVTVRVRSVATRGKAALVFSGNGSKSVVALKNGTHTTKAVAVPKGLKKVSIGHRWAKGDVTLTSVRAIFRYKKLI